MNLMDDMRERAKADVQRVAFFEGENPTMIKAVAELTAQGLASCVVVGNVEAIERNAAEQGVSLEGVELVDLADEEANEALAQRFEVLPSCRWKAKGVRRRVVRPMERALMMQALGDVDITFGGIDCPTGDVILGGQEIIGLADGIDTISSMGIFDIPGYEGSAGQLLGFGDSAVCQNPTPEQEASIAISACDTWNALTGSEARCALLSFSTDGSGAGEMVQKVRDARDIANERRPDLKIDGEFQLDAALRPEVAAHKVHRESAVAGKANERHHLARPQRGQRGCEARADVWPRQRVRSHAPGLQEDRLRLLEKRPRVRDRGQRRDVLRARAVPQGGVAMTEKNYRILVINPGSTSTKVGLFEGETCVFSKNVSHDAQRLAQIGDVSSQLPYRRDMIMGILDENGVDLSTIDAFVGRGGGLLSLEGGVYSVDETLLNDARRGANGVQHPAQLGSQLAHELAASCGKPAFVVNPPDTDELCDDARMTGIRGVYRNVHLHALNLKETAIRHAKTMGRRYEDCDFIVCHIGGGTSCATSAGGSPSRHTSTAA